MLFVDIYVFYLRGMINESAMHTFVFVMPAVPFTKAVVMIEATIMVAFGLQRKPELVDCLNKYQPRLVAKQSSDIPILT